jgi:hypothetical protein
MPTLPFPESGHGGDSYEVAIALEADLSELPFGSAFDKFV